MRLIAREVDRQQEADKYAARVLVSSAVTSVLRRQQAAQDAVRLFGETVSLFVKCTVISAIKQQLMRNCRAANIRPSTVFRPHIQLVETLQTLPALIVIVPTRSVVATTGRCACDAVAFQSIPRANLPELPMTFKEKKRSERLHALACNIRLKTLYETLPHAFRCWQSAWHFSQYTLRQLANEVVADLSPLDCHSDLRRTASWSPQEVISKISLFDEEVDKDEDDEETDLLLQARHLALHHTVTWPTVVKGKTFAKAKGISKHQRRVCRRW